MIDIDFFDSNLELEEEEKDFILSCFVETDTEDKDTSSSRSTDGKQKKVRSPKTANLSVPLNDVRRTFASSFEAVFNRYDRSELVQLFHSICREDCVVTISYPKGNPHGPLYREMAGLPAVIDYYDKAFMSVPDCVFLIHKTKICVLPENMSSVICKYSISGSRVQFVNLLKKGDDDTIIPVIVDEAIAVEQTQGAGLQQIRFKNNNHPQKSNATRSTMGEFVYTNKKEMAMSTLKSETLRRRKRKMNEEEWKVTEKDCVVLSPALPTPLPSRFAGVIHFHCDANKKIYRIDSTAVL